EGGASRPSLATRSVREVAQQLRSRGIALCKPDPAEKKSTYKGWPTYSLELDDFGPDDQIGIIAGPLSDGNDPGHALVIVDLDSPAAIARPDAYLPETAMADGRPSSPTSHRCNR